MFLVVEIFTFKLFQSIFRVKLDWIKGNPTPFSSLSSWRAKMTCHFHRNQANCRVDVYFLQIRKCRLNISLPTIIVLSWETNLAIIFKNSTEVGRGHKKLLEGSCNAIGLISSCLFIFKKKFVLKWTPFEIVFSHPQNII